MRQITKWFHLQGSPTEAKLGRIREIRRGLSDVWETEPPHVEEPKVLGWAPVDKGSCVHIDPDPKAETCSRLKGGCENLRGMPLSEFWGGHQVPGFPWEALLAAFGRWEILCHDFCEISECSIGQTLFFHAASKDRGMAVPATGACAKSVSASRVTENKEASYERADEFS